MPDPNLNPKQTKALEHPTRSAIYDFLKGYDKPASMGEIAEAVEIAAIDVVHYHVNRLVEVALVENVFGIVRYQVVER